MTQEQFIKKYNLKEVTEPVRNSDGKYIDKLAGYTATLHSISYDLHISVILHEQSDNCYRLILKSNISTALYSYPGKEIFAMHTTELSLAEKITEDLINTYINL